MHEKNLNIDASFSFQNDIIKNMKHEQMGAEYHKKLSGLTEGLTDEAKRAEDQNKDFKYLKNVFSNPENKLPDGNDEEIAKITKGVDLDAHVDYINKSNQQKNDLEEKRKEGEGLTKVAQKIQQKIDDLKERIRAGGILPNKKEQLETQLSSLEKLKKETINYASLAKAEINVISNKEYEKPKHPGENIRLN